MDAMFSAAQAYERFMGRWSRTLAPLLVRFAGIEHTNRVLDLGCGTGALTTAIHAAVPSARVVAIDRSAPYVAFARSRQASGCVHFQVGDAQHLPLAHGSVDATLSLLTVNFMPDPYRAVTEMMRVTRRGGTVATAVWDYAQGMEMLRIFWDEAIAVSPGMDASDERHMPFCRSGQLSSLWSDSGLQHVVEQPLSIVTAFTSCDDYWSAFEQKQGPAGACVAAIPPSQREELRLRLQARLAGDGPDRPIVLNARAWAVRGIVPPADSSS
jgi:SAM-dependent methyltransferase